MPKKSKSASELKPKKAKNPTKKEELKQAYIRLETRLNEIEIQLQQAAEQRGQLLSLLHQAVTERASTQSQLDWVLYRLEQLNPEQMHQTLSQLEQWMNGAATTQHQYTQSEVGMDFGMLQSLLAAGKWQKADEETWNLVLKITGRLDEGWMAVEDMLNFPCTDLRTIDWLWHQYSNGKFGLTAQKEIWETVNNNYTDFADKIGWRVRENWIYYNEIDFSLNAPKGHLPVIVWRRRACYGVGRATAGESISYLISRLIHCNT